MPIPIEPVPSGNGDVPEEDDAFGPEPQPMEHAARAPMDMPDVNESGMSRLRKRYEQLDDGIERFTVPSYGELVEGVGMVWPFQGRYQRLDPQVIRRLKREADAFPDPPMAFNIQMLVESCVELGTLGAVTVEHPEGEFIPLSNDPDDPIRWDNRLVVGLGLEPVDAPDDLLGGLCLERAFKGNKQAINEHSADVYGWMIYGRAVLLAGADKDGKEPGKG